MKLNKFDGYVYSTFLVAGIYCNLFVLIWNQYTGTIRDSYHNVSRIKLLIHTDGNVSRTKHTASYALNKWHRFTSLLNILTSCFILIYFVWYHYVSTRFYIIYLHATNQNDSFDFNQLFAIFLLIINWIISIWKKVGHQSFFVGPLVPSGDGCCSFQSQDWSLMLSKVVK